MPPTDSYLVFDFETTGLDPQRDRIIQVGLCAVTDGRVTDRRTWLVNQEVEVPAEATRIHGITTADIRARGIPPRESLCRLFEAMTVAPACVGHNIHQFDILFLLGESRRMGTPAPDFANAIDTAALFKGWKLSLPIKPEETHKSYADHVLAIRAPGLKYSIPACLQALGVRADASMRHEASADAYLTHLIFEALRPVLVPAVNR